MPDTFLTQLARPRPDPGGGAAAAYAARVAVALLLKVAHLEAPRSRPGPGSPEVWEEILKEAERLAHRFRQLQDEDVEAYRGFARARAAGSGLLQAVRAATRCPLNIMNCALATLELAGRAGALCQPHLLSDLLVAVELLGGALQGAYHIASANLPWFEAVSERRNTAATLVRARDLGEAALWTVRLDLMARPGPSGGTP
ncbi:MAG: cyclodeaminase/cyclohydrolase family protein [Deltaproteobacteria bacterium]|nr:cyclodeaminase/cyclohydrolase family protein [Deltaproteobacteria bacterium]